MLTEVTDKNQYKEIFNSSEASFLQSYEWGEVKKPEWETIRISLNNKPLTILTRSIPLTNKKLAYIPRPSLDEVLLENELKEILEYLSTKNISHLEIDPENQNTDSIQKQFQRSGFFETGKQYQLNNSNILGLTVGVENLWNTLSSSTRNKVRKPEKMGCKVEVFYEGDEAVERFWEIMRSITENTTYVSHPKPYFQKVWKNMSEVSMAKIVIISLDGKDIGGYFLVRNKNKICELYGGLNKEGRNIRGAGYYLKWESIKSAQEDGIELYDQWGVSPKNSDGNYLKEDVLYHISLFKKEFGGEDIQYLPQQTYVFNKLSYRIFRLGKLLLSLSLKLKKLLR